MCFALNEIIARNLQLRRVVGDMRSKAGGRVLSAEEASDCGIPNEHVLAIPTLPGDKMTTGYLTGRYARRNPDVGVESVKLRSGAIAHVRDTVMTHNSWENGNAEEEVPGRIVGIFLDAHKQPQASTGTGIQSHSSPSPLSLFAEIRPFVHPSRVQRGGATRVGNAPRMWEPVGEEDVRIVRVGALQSLCTVIPDEILRTSGSSLGHTQSPTIAGAGFVRRAQRMSGRSNQKAYSVTTTPWRREGDEGLQFDLRDTDVQHPLEGQAVAKCPLWAFSDAFNAYNHNGTQCSVNATYAGFGCVSRELERRLGWSHLCSIAGPGVQWQPEHTPLAKILQGLQRGCRAKVAIPGEDGTKEVR